VAVDGGRLTDRAYTPALYREGKMAIIEEVIGQRPVLVAGDAITDYEMLCGSAGLSLVIERGDELLRREGSGRGWLMQPQEQLTVREME
jgi:phosphoserine phosphatase